MVEKTKTKETKEAQVKSANLTAPNRTSSDSECKDNRCPIHSNLSTRGRIFEGIVINDKMNKNIRVEWTYLYYLPKYERYEKRRTRVKAHNPTCINVKKGDKVRISECRPLSKTVNFVVIEKLSTEEKK